MADPLPPFLKVGLVLEDPDVVLVVNMPVLDGRGPGRVPVGDWTGSRAVLEEMVRRYNAPQRDLRLIATALIVAGIESGNRTRQPPQRQDKHEIVGRAQALAAILFEDEENEHAAEVSEGPE